MIYPIACRSASVRPKCLQSNIGLRMLLNPAVSILIFWHRQLHLQLQGSFFFIRKKHYERIRVANVSSQVSGVFGNILFALFLDKNPPISSTLLHLIDMFLKLELVELATQLYKRISICHCISKKIDSGVRVMLSL